MNYFVIGDKKEVDNMSRLISDTNNVGRIVNKVIKYSAQDPILNQRLEKASKRKKNIKRGSLFAVALSLYIALFPFNDACCERDYQMEIKNEKSLPNAPHIYGCEPSEGYEN